MTRSVDRALGAAGKVVTVVSLVVMLPAVLFHEGAHAVVAIAGGGDVELDRVLPPRLRFEWPEGTRVATVLLAQLAPTIAGLAIAPFVFRWAAGLPLPATAYVGCTLLLQVPSADDLNFILR